MIEKVIPLSNHESIEAHHPRHYDYLEEDSLHFFVLARKEAFGVYDSLSRVLDPK
jgi:hypothetical protein